MNLFRTSLAATVLACATFAGCSSDGPKLEPQKPLSYEDSVNVSVTAKVKTIDYATRFVTLQDQQGHEVSFVVDNSVRRLNEVMPGDNVKAQYRADLIAELRPPTPEEAATPIAAVELAGRTPQGSTPAAGVAQGLRVVTTVAAVDVPNMLVTLRGPMGDLAVVKGRKPENIKRLKVGDTVVITYVESVAIGLEKTSP